MTEIEFNLRLTCRYPYHFSKQPAAAYISTCKMGRDLVRLLCTCSRISVHYYETSYGTCRDTNAWPLIGSKFAKNSWKLDKVDKTRCTWPFQAKNRYDVTLANRRAPGVWFVRGFKMYLFLATNWPGIPSFVINRPIACYFWIPGYSIIPAFETIHLDHV